MSPRRSATTKALRELALDVDLHAADACDDDLPQRPRTRGDCVNSMRPCPWVGCRHHLFIDVNQSNGSILFNFFDKEPWELVPSCSLDVADKGGALDDGGCTLEDIGKMLGGLSREAVRLIEKRAIERAQQMMGRNRE